MDEERKKARSTKPVHNTFVRTGKRRTAPARGNTACAAQFFPAPVPSRMEQRGFLALKDMSEKRPLNDRLEEGLEWFRNKYHIVFTSRSEISDADEMECLGITQAAISDFTVDNFVYSVFAGVAELPYIGYPFNVKNKSAEKTGKDKERFDEIVGEYNRIFWAIKREMKKRVENDAYFLNSQLRSHTIWFLEKFFSMDLTPPEVVEDSKVEFEVVMPEPLPEEVQRALQN